MNPVYVPPLSVPLVFWGGPTSLRDPSRELIRFPLRVTQVSSTSSSDFAHDDDLRYGFQAQKRDCLCVCMEIDLESFVPENSLQNYPIVRQHQWTLSCTCQMSVMVPAPSSTMAPFALTEYDPSSFGVTDNLYTESRSNANSDIHNRGCIRLGATKWMWVWLFLSCGLIKKFNSYPESLKPTAPVAAVPMHMAMSKTFFMLEKYNAPGSNTNYFELTLNDDNVADKCEKYGGCFHLCWSETRQPILQQMM